MSSRSSLMLSKLDLAGDYNTQDVSFASRDADDDHRPPATRSTKQRLMRRLGSLLNPKKKAKSGSKALLIPTSTLAVAEGAGAAMAGAGVAVPAGKDDLVELLFAQAEATLGELLVKAGASFGSSRSMPHDHHQAAQDAHIPERAARSITGGADDAVEAERSSNFKDNASAQLQGTPAGQQQGHQQGHARRNSSLSRVWQQLGGTLFCGGSQMVSMDMAPLPAQTQTFYGDGVDDEADESYWRSLAESILVERQKLAELKDQTSQILNDAEHGTRDYKDNLTEINSDPLPSITPARQQIYTTASEPEQDMSYQTCNSISLSEIVPSETVCAADAGTVTDIIRVSVVISDCADDDHPCSWQSPDDPLLIHVDCDGSSRLNTTLDASPVLAQNYHLLQKEDMSASSSRNVDEHLHRSLQPVVECQVAMAAANSTCSCSTAISGSNTVVDINMSNDVQPLENFLWEARAAESAKSSARRDDEEAAAAAPQIDAVPCITADVNNSSEQHAGETASVEAASSRVSLMTLLHEEAAGSDSPAVQTVQVEVVEDGGGAGLQAEDRRRREEELALIWEEPLALFCCVCMVRRKGAALIPCGHTFCRICSKQLFAGRGACPLCNNLIVQLLDIF